MDSFCLRRRSPRGRGWGKKHTPPLAGSVFGWVSVKGYPKRFIKTIKPSLQIFLDALPLTCG
ncbi:hypothetical protein NM96_11340 [Neisseria mucosa]|nr:hypothetical protein NM96_01785 [Neisseria mucosa]AVR79837.1 hypothetical protein NM96_11340 [Neisseria mucosa]